LEAELGIGPGPEQAGLDNATTCCLPLGAVERPERSFELDQAGDTELSASQMTRRSSVSASSTAAKAGDVNRSPSSDRTNSCGMTRRVTVIRPRDLNLGWASSVDRVAVGKADDSGIHRAAAVLPCSTPSGADQAQTALSQVP
jgi:hypothetical protein